MRPQGQVCNRYRSLHQVETLKPFKEIYVTALKLQKGLYCERFELKDLCVHVCACLCVFIFVCEMANRFTVVVILIPVIIHAATCEGDLALGLCLFVDALKHLDECFFINDAAKLPALCAHD